MARAATPVMLDVDPGHDDAVALVLACAAPELEVRAVTTVAGNASLPETTRNALRVLSLVGRRDVPVGAGAATPLRGDHSYTGEYAHGEGGLGRFEPDDGSITLEPDRRGAVDLMADVVEGSEEPITLVALGPLTNVATFLARRPELVDKVARIVLMGGSAGRGNVTPAAEFNFYADPEAARAVFRSGLGITMCGLDATRKAIVGPEEVRRLRASGRLGKLVAEILDSYAYTYAKATGARAPAVHDAVAVAAVVEPEILETRAARVAIECEGEHTRGMSVCDLDGVWGREPNAEVALDLDRTAFFKVMHRYLGGRAG